MAQVTGGKYFRAIKEDSLTGVFNEINKLETTKVEDNKYVRYEEYFYLFLMAGIAAFIFNRLLAFTLLKVGP
jgi:Ca-activated chloride channel family protein